MPDTENVSGDTDSKVTVLTLGQWLDVADMAWERARTLPWQERHPYFSLLACVNVYLRIFSLPREGEPVGHLDLLVGIPYSAIEGLGLDIVAVSTA
jgi:hypothetical protein